MIQGVARRICVKYVGRMSYERGLQLQAAMAANHHVEGGGIKDTLLLIEHPPVYTLGRRLHENEDEAHRLRALGAEYFKTQRGGQITFHGPGQLVGYPILNLANYKKSVKWYIKSIEDMLIDVCASYGLHATTTKDTGVWIEDRKVAAIGVSVSRLVTQHGFALNCNTDLDWFSHIVPCGIVGKGVTSLAKEAGRNVTLEDVIPKVVESFGKVFDAEMILEQPVSQ